MIVAEFPFGAPSRRDCFEFRIGIEGEAAAAAARNRSHDDLRRLAAAIEALVDAGRSGGSGIDEDFQFHLDVARAAQNDYFVSVLTSLRDTIFEGMLLARTTTGLRTAEKIAAIECQHRLVYEAIVDADDIAARSAMREHLQRCKSSTSHWDLSTQ